MSVDFQHAPTPPKPKKGATEKELAGHRQKCAEAGLPLLAAGRIRHLRKTPDRMPGGGARVLWMQGDGGHTSTTILRGLPERTVYTGRLRKDAKLYRPAAVADPKDSGFLTPTERFRSVLCVP